MKPIYPLLVSALAISAAAPAAQAQAAADTAARNWHLLDPTGDRVPGISAERAYRELLAGRQARDTIVVAIIDSGVEVDHPDLDGVIWTNADEVPGNGRDDDRNGYVDDVHGWNFIGGANGQNVDFDTYEVTRLYGQLRPRFENATAASVSAADRADFELWQRVRPAYETRRQEETEYAQTLRTVEANVNAIAAMLRSELRVDSLTTEAVRGLRPSSAQVGQAQQYYLQLAGMGYTPARITEEREAAEKRVRYSLDPAFNPRTIVGDDPNNLTQRGYGNNDYEGPDADHGTHVAGIVAAERGGEGVDGVAGAVRIMVVRAVPNGDERDKDVANAIRYAVDNGARVINMSFGKSFSPNKALVDEAVRYAAERNVLLVHAAGNDNEDVSESPSFPTPVLAAARRAANWIEVGASSWRGGEHLAADFSNYDESLVDVFAPGVAILSTVTDRDYGRNDGTSMAAPVVSGVAALLMSYYPELTAEQVRQIILESSTRFQGQNVVLPGDENRRVPFSSLSASGGVVNVYAAIQAAERMARR